MHQYSLNVNLNSRVNQINNSLTTKLASPTERIVGLIAAMTNAADALMRHQGQANKVRIKATRTTDTLSVFADYHYYYCALSPFSVL